MDNLLLSLKPSLEWKDGISSALVLNLRSYVHTVHTGQFCEQLYSLHSSVNGP